MAKVIHKKGSEELAKLFLETYDPQSSDNAQNSFNDMIRNSVKYLSYKDRKNFCNHLKQVYKAPNKKIALLEFEKFKELKYMY